MISITISIFHRKLLLLLLVVVLSLYCTALQTSTANLNLEKTWKNPYWIERAMFIRKIIFSPNHAAVWDRKEWDTLVLWCELLFAMGSLCALGGSRGSPRSSDDCEIWSPDPRLFERRTHAGHLIRSPPAHLYSSTVTTTLWSPSLILRRKLWGVLLRYLYLEALFFLQTNKRESDCVCSGLEMHDSLSDFAFVFW